MENGEKEKRKMNEKEKKLNNKSNISYFEHSFSVLSPLYAILLLPASIRYSLASCLLLTSTVYHLPFTVYLFNIGNFELGSVFYDITK